MPIFETQIFGLHIAPTWYGLMYALGFGICYIFMSRASKLTKSELETLLYFVFCGVLLGGRIGYVILYNPAYFLEHPSEIFAFWNGGMSFHGGFLGTLVGVALFAKKYHKKFFEITDPLAVIIPIALGLGRLGNWINRELPGYSPYTGPFAMIQNNESYFPSPLLQMLLEGGLLLVVMLALYRKNPERKLGFFSAVFLIGYSIARLIGEQFRLPDTHIGYLFGTNWMTLGILYTLPMLLFGIFLLMRTNLSLRSRAN